MHTLAVHVSEPELHTVLYSIQSAALPRVVTCCRYDVIWMQWALLYLTDGKVSFPIECPLLMLRIAIAPQVCREQNYL